MIDLHVVFSLLAITCLEDATRVDDEALVVRRTLWHSWVVARLPNVGGRKEFMMRWAPLSTTLVLPPSPCNEAERRGYRRHASRALTARLRKVRTMAIVLRLLGCMELAGLVVGMPSAVALYGGWGFAAMLSIVITLSLGIVMLTTLSLRRLGVPLATAMRRAVVLLSPFSAPHGTGVVLQQATSHVPRLVVARHLLGEKRFAEWIRPWAYDAIRNHREGAPSSLSAEVLRMLGEDALETLVGTPPQALMDDSLYCPRCATAYRLGTCSCTDCDGVRLVGQDSEAVSQVAIP